MDLGDLAEYMFAETYLGGWDHWLLMQRSFVLKPHIEKWRAELRLKIEAASLAKLRDMAEGEGPQALQAAKYLYERVAGDNASRKRGRPSKAEKEAAIKRELRDSEDIRADADRLGLKVIK